MSDKMTTAETNSRPSHHLSTVSSSALLRLILVIALIFRVHDVQFSFPTVTPVVYPAAEGQDVSYGLRIVVPLRGQGNPPPTWQAEIGKISDDNLRNKMMGSYVGLADNFFYFKIDSPEQSHLLLASLWMVSLHEIVQSYKLC